MLVDQLRLQGVERVFCVPGESYLAALDGLFDAGIDVVNARHEGGAAMMAEADGKLTGRPGIAFVTRGPGATNASAGVHVAFQDSTPMILFVGQVASDQRDREAFQEVDYRALFAPLAKAVYELERSDRIAEYVARAFAVASNGRPGPVVVALPEDRLSACVDVTDVPPSGPVDHGCSQAARHALLSMLDEAERPLLIVGGGGWSSQAQHQIERLADERCLPVATSFRCQDYVRNSYRRYIGHLGIAPDPALIARVRESDLIVALGCRLGEMTTSGFTVFEPGNPRQRLVHVHADANELGRIYRPTLGIVGRVAALVEQLVGANDRGSTTDDDAHRGGDDRWRRRTAWIEQARADFERWTVLPAADDTLTVAGVVARLADVLPDDAIVCNGAGNYAGPVHRYHRFERYRTQLAPTSGSMGYGLPAAIAASLRYPERSIVCFAGDGCFQMTMQEFGLAAERACRLVVLVCDNRGYGTIKAHQERSYPGRAVGTSLVNPDFAALARSYGATGETISEAAQLADALQRALSAPGPALLHIVLPSA